jgi:hypothetical protein
VPAEVTLRLTAKQSEASDTLPLAFCRVPRRSAADTRTNPRSRRIMLQVRAGADREQM